jgi:hypothetical protein
MDSSHYLAQLEDKRRRLRRYLRLGIFVAGAAVFGGGLVWVLVFSPAFKIERVTVEGVDELQADNLKGFLQARVYETRWGKLLGIRHGFGWPNEAPREEIVKTFPSVKNVTLTKRYSENEILVAVEERRAVGIWCLVRRDPWRCMWFDEDGIAFSPAPQTEGSLLWVVEDAATENLSLGGRVAPDREIKHLQSIFRVIQGTGISGRRVRLEDFALEEVSIDSSEGPKLYFSLRFAADAASAVLSKLMNDSRAGILERKLEEMDYIDFRVENRAYYK